MRKQLTLRGERCTKFYGGTKCPFVFFYCMCFWAHPVHTYCIYNGSFSEVNSTYIGQIMICLMICCRPHRSVAWDVPCSRFQKVEIVHTSLITIIVQFHIFSGISFPCLLFFIIHVFDIGFVNISANPKSDFLFRNHNFDPLIQKHQTKEQPTQTSATSWYH